MAQCVVHALKGLACRARVALASSPASHCKRSRRLRSTRAAAPVLLAHANVTENINILSMGPKLRYPTVFPCRIAVFVVRSRRAPRRDSPVVEETDDILDTLRKQHHAQPVVKPPNPKYVSPTRRTGTAAVATTRTNTHSTMNPLSQHILDSMSPLKIQGLFAVHNNRGRTPCCVFWL